MLPRAADVVVEVAMQVDLEPVLPVEREVVLRGEAAPRPERQVLARADVLHLELGHRVGLAARRHRGVADRELADPPRRRQVALHQRRRDRQHLGVVVEALGVRIVGRQQGLDVHVEPQQVAHRVPVLEPVEAMHGHRPPDRRTGVGRAVQRRLHPGDPGAARGVVGPPRGGRRHHPAPHLPHRHLQEIGVGADLRQVEPLQGEGHGAALESAVAVTRDAVPLHEGVRRRLVGNRLGLARVGRHNAQRHRDRGSARHLEQPRHGHHPPILKSVAAGRRSACDARVWALTVPIPAILRRFAAAVNRRGRTGGSNAGARPRPPRPPASRDCG